LLTFISLLNAGQNRLVVDRLFVGHAPWHHQDEHQQKHAAKRLSYSVPFSLLISFHSILTVRGVSRQASWGVPACNASTRARSCQLPGRLPAYASGLSRFDRSERLCYNGPGSHRSAPILPTRPVSRGGHPQQPPHAPPTAAGRRDNCFPKKDPDIWLIQGLLRILCVLRVLCGRTEPSTYFATSGKYSTWSRGYIQL
jgi:hypothetical protein